MDKIITPEVETQLKEKFAQDLKGEVDVRLFTKSILMAQGEDQRQFIEFSQNLLRELAALEPRIKLTELDFDNEIARELSLHTSPTVIIGYDKGYKIIYNGSPSGYEIGGFIEVLTLVSSGQSGLPETLEKLVLVAEGKVEKIQVFVTPTCPYCPKAVVTAHQMAIASKGKITSECVESYEDQETAQKLGVASVPHTIINGDVDKTIIGALPEPNFIKTIIRFVDASLLPKEEKLPEAPEGVVTLSDANFKEALIKYPKLVVDFWAEWCVPCKVMGPQFEDLSGKYAGKVVFGKLNVDDNPISAGLYEVLSIPMLIMFKDGNKAGQTIGAMPPAEIEKHITQTFES